MLEYAAGRRQIASRPSSPHAMLFIISAHVALLALAMSAKMDVTNSFPKSPALIRIRLTPEPPPNRVQPPRTPQPKPQSTFISRTYDIVPPQSAQQQVATGPAIDPTPIELGGSSTMPVLPQPRATAPIHHDALLLTPPWQLKPPYPASKLASEEEATLRLRLTIDDHGRVVAVDPVGSADRVFLDAARRYMIAHWRYAPATQDGQPVATTITVTLQFQLDG
jgi:protein TonB